MASVKMESFLAVPQFQILMIAPTETNYCTTNLIHGKSNLFSILFKTSNLESQQHSRAPWQSLALLRNLGLLVSN
jgi:hypothetical protein